jgi:hypothetical protein
MPCGIRTHDQSFRAGEDSSCLRPLGYSDPLRYGCGASEQILQNQSILVSVVLTAMLKKSLIFCHITPCSPLKINRCFGRRNRLHHQDFLANYFMLISFCLIFRPCKWKQYAPPKRRLTFNLLRGVIPRKIKLFNQILVLRRLQPNIFGFSCKDIDP